MRILFILCTSSKPISRFTLGNTIIIWHGDYFLFFESFDEGQLHYKTDDWSDGFFLVLRTFRQWNITL